MTAGKETLNLVEVLKLQGVLEAGFMRRQLQGMPQISMSMATEPRRPRAYLSLLYIKELQSLKVMLRLRPKAQSRAKPAVKKPSQAGPFRRLQMAFGPAQAFIKPEPGALAAAFYVINYVLFREF